MIKKQRTIGQREADVEVKERVSRQVKYRCIAFWSGTTTITAYAAHWATDNIEPIKIGLKAFLEAWLKS